MRSILTHYWEVEEILDSGFYSKASAQFEGWSGDLTSLMQAKIYCISFIFCIIYFKWYFYF